MKKIEEIHDRLSRVEEKVSNIEKILKPDDEGKLIVCNRCNHNWKTKSKMKTVSCPNCGFKVKNASQQEQKKLINKRHKENPDYAKGKDIETVMEDMDF